VNFIIGRGGHNGKRKRERENERKRGGERKVYLARTRKKEDTWGRKDGNARTASAF